ncbi:cupin domain-containing protein [Natronobacterium gregoryi]|uniref:Cupin 2 conserved barrel domain protein n=2 Tax=Natronobacterium gregoryi TaxID=44930 RepID=L0AF15_NATGS|nr:cupin domain-containing protein [Natronobacterium gregoryi]AFZ71722.1 cupin domain-containing protein [Natronobacterium gregoryi SP2]ELY72705.1 Cupin 2 conserved barrel domain protein [Natronobacterium gregoryi SP2]PLK20230.1 cupin domain-containing protein [Natronobacterium gregoryi SP2]SFJ26632.1 Cupin domain-containing protein [Natronobacterium gregoryi]
MSYRKVNYEDVDQVSSAMHFLSDPLETAQVGVTVARCDPGWKSKPHDHTDNDHEEVYVLIEGEATVVVDDEPVEMEAGDALSIPPEATRQIRNGNGESAFVLVSAPSIADDEGDDEWLLSGFAG